MIVQIDCQDVPAGQLWFHSAGDRQSSTFRYEPSYIAAGHYPLSPDLPLVEGAQHTAPGQAMFGAFADCSPDRWGRRLLDQEQRARAGDEGKAPHTLREADYLLAARDDLRQGALRFRAQPDAPFLAAGYRAAPRLRDLPALLGAADRLGAGRPAPDDLRLLVHAGSGLGGARPKVHVQEGGRSLIAKLPSAHDTWDVMVWEAVALTLAARCGITVARHRLDRIAGRSVLILDRFDRRGERRIGYISAMTMLATAHGAPGDYLDIAGEGSLTAADLRELWRRIAFGRLIANTDDHLRNHGFLRLNQSGWVLAPAFDLNPNPAGREFATTLVGAATFDSVSDLVEAAPFFGVSDAEARQTIASIAEELAGWRTVAARYNAPSRDISLMESVFDSEVLTQARGLTATH